MTYKGHHGLLHYTPEDYTLEVFSDSDWAKHRSTRKSVSSGFIFLFGNLLYSSSRSQKALALSSAEAEIYAATSACCDGVLLEYCLCFIVGGEDKVVTFIKMDNSVGRSSFLRSGVGRIRHISVRVLWMQQRVKEKGLIPSKVPSRENPSDLVAKRLTNDRMEYLMCLCKVYNMDTSEFVGMNAYDKIQEQDNMKAIRLLKEQGYSAPKQLLRILLLALRPSEMAMAFSTDAVSADSSPASSFMDYKNVMIATLLTLLCGALAACFYLRFALGVARGENFARGMDKTLHQVLDIPEKIKWVGEYMKERLKPCKRNVAVIWTVKCVKFLMTSIGVTSTMGHLGPMSMIMEKEKDQSFLFQMILQFVLHLCRLR